MYPPLESVTILVIININTTVSEHVSPTRVCNLVIININTAVSEYVSPTRVCNYSSYYKYKYNSF